MKSRILSFEPEIENIIQKCRYCSLAMVDLEGKPYVLHMNFGFRDKVLYLHAAPEGKKIDILKQNPDVCVAFSTDHLLRWQNIDVACSYTMKYRSVLLYGKVEFVEDMKQKEDALNVIMNQYTDENYRYSEPAIRNVCVFTVKAERIEGRAFGY
jgi:nitroimidazol reductase NimA-like FMN-containing flavoprotein (pyridoxamine 5'-phosphate oxidase superfamily)